MEGGHASLGNGELEAIALAGRYGVQKDCGAVDVPAMEPIGEEGVDAVFGNRAAQIDQIQKVQSSGRAARKASDVDVYFGVGVFLEPFLDLKAEVFMGLLGVGVAPHAGGRLDDSGGGQVLNGADALVIARGERLVLGVAKMDEIVGDQCLLVALGDVFAIVLGAVEVGDKDAQIGVLCSGAGKVGDFGRSFDGGGQYVLLFT